MTLFRGTTIINSACMIRRSVARGLGGDDPALVVYEDVDFFCRGILQYGHVFVDTPALPVGNPHAARRPGRQA